jgi:hypothetical protein
MGNEYNRRSWYIWTDSMPRSANRIDSLRKLDWYYKRVLEGKCQKCGYQCIGWALRFVRNQSCPKCGAGLEIREDGRRIKTGYSPFSAEKYSIDLPPNFSPSKKSREGQP